MVLQAAKVLQGVSTEKKSMDFPTSSLQLPVFSLVASRYLKASRKHRYLESLASLACFPSTNQYDSYDNMLKLDLRMSGQQIQIQKG